jgi:hypothetical protein
MDFKKTYNNTPESIKLSFLDAIIGQNQKLQAEFIAYVETKISKTDELSYNTFISIVNEYHADYQKCFEAVDLEDPDWDNYNPPHVGYIEEWEAYQLASEQEFEDIFDEFRNDAINTIIEQRPDELTAMLIGLYEATQDANVPDEVCSFEDVNEHLLSELKNTLNTVVDKLRMSALTENNVATAFEMFFMYCNEEYPGNPHFASHFENLFISMAEKCGNANALLNIFDHSGIEKEIMPELTLVLNKLAGNKTEWLHSALQFYHDSEPVAKELLHHYFETDKTAFLKTARELYEINKTTWALFLQNYLTPELDQQLYIKIHYTLTVATKDIGHYLKIMDLLSENEKNILLDNIRYDDVFVVEILNAEKRYADIKAIVEKEDKLWRFDKKIAPILPVYPGFCLQRIGKMVTSTLQNERGRSVYERVCKLLNLTKSIPGFEQEKMMLIQQTYTHKPNLPALRDEMRQAGLVE